MLRFTLVSLVFLVCAANANLLDSIVGKKVVVVTEEETEKVQLASDNAEPSDETALAVIDNDTPIAAMDDLGAEGQSNGAVIRAKRYYGCGCGCCGCATVDPAATPAPCGCGCCGCG
ncbi:hypothetical protein GCK72_023682 [Caenorhabditis remanei]|uniref:Uncharacterized protein n=1 Tax=Caenorhabditis remanei TaxID=31234 RepID=A0A6A5FX01_CAERE|nr:hypothetical protein GCK72_023682 [Caenorhabditis remanei]KAF1747220.1 hypothetical protein GCK72_023682 [Caenorhabditis remanei]